MNPCHIIIVVVEPMDTERFQANVFHVQTELERLSVRVECSTELGIPRNFPLVGYICFCSKTREILKFRSLGRNCFVAVTGCVGYC